MNIQNAIRKFGDEKRGKEAHISGETDEADFVFVENGGDLAVIGFAFEAFRGDYARLDAARFGALDAGGAFAIADDDGDLRVGDTTRRDAFGEGFEVRAAAA